MNGVKKRMGTWVAVGMLSASLLLTGCSLGEPRSAVSLLKRASENNYDNVHAVISSDIDMGMEVMGFDLSVPMELDMDMAIADGSTSKGTMDLAVSVMGFEISSASEFYMDEEFMYSQWDESGEWVKSAREDSALDLTGGMSVLDLLQTVTSSEIVFEKDEANDVYRLTFPASIILENSDVLDQAMAAAGMGEVTDMQIDAGDASVRCTFDHDTCRLTSLVMDEIAVSMIVDENPVNMTMTLDVALDQFGEIAAEEVTVPEEVRNNAVESDGETPGALDFLE